VTVHSLLLACQVQHALKRSDDALGTLDRAINIDSNNPLCKFHRASVLFATDRHQVSSLGQFTRSGHWVSSLGHVAGSDLNKNSVIGWMSPSHWYASLWVGQKWTWILAVSSCLSVVC